MYGYLVFNGLVHYWRFVSPHKHITEVSHAYGYFASAVYIIRVILFSLVSMLQR